MTASTRARRVYKIGGPALEDPKLLAPLAREINAFDGDVALVHGGGRQVERMLKQLGIESKFIDGRRATSPLAMEIVEMVLTGSMNQALAAGLARAGASSIGISGRDGGLVRAALVPGLGQVGTPGSSTVIPMYGPINLSQVMFIHCWMPGP